MRLLLAVFVVSLSFIPAALAARSPSPYVLCGGCADGSGFPPCNDFNTGQIYSPDGGRTYYRCTFSLSGDYWARVN